MSYFRFAAHSRVDHQSRASPGRLGLVFQPDPTCGNNYGRYCGYNVQGNPGRRWYTNRTHRTWHRSVGRRQRQLETTETKRSWWNDLMIRNAQQWDPLPGSNTCNAGHYNALLVTLKD